MGLAGIRLGSEWSSGTYSSTFPDCTRRKSEIEKLSTWSRRNHSNPTRVLFYCRLYVNCVLILVSEREEKSKSRSRNRKVPCLFSFPARGLSYTEPVSSTTKHVYFT